MNPAHVHLLLNHLPVVGALFGVLLLSVAVLKKSAELKKVSLGVFVVLALISIPAYLTGEPAADGVEHLPGVSKPLIERHEEAAEISFAVAGVAGVVALAGLFFFRRSSDTPRWFVAIAFVLSLVVSGWMAWTANLGGQIRHTEIPSGGPSSTVDEPKLDIQKRKAESEREHE